MKRTIAVEPVGGEAYRVTVTEGDSKTIHRVTVPKSDRERYGADRTTEDLLIASFEFLLKHEPKESILRAFVLRDIEKYFPDFPSEIRHCAA